ncbi:MAG: extracellular solute-binding protein [Lachnospiraceae bacterium]
MKKRLLSAILAGVTAASMLLSACGSTTETATQTTTSSGESGEAAVEGGESDFSEHMVISLAHWDIETAFAERDSDKLYQYICDKFNISIEPVNTTWDDYVQKIQMWAASGSMPDIVSIDAVGTSTYYNWTEQGVVRPLLDIDETKYPNLAEYFKTEDIAAMADENGQFYAVPRRMFPTVDWSALDRVVAYRWDLAQEAGITKEPETWDEFKDMLAAIVEADPEGQNIVGLTSSTVKMVGGLFWLYSNPVATSDGSGSDFKWIKEDGKYVPAVFSSNSLASLQNMRDMYTNGLIDPDIALTNTASAYDKFAAGNCAAILLGGGFINVSNNLYEQRWKDLYPDKEFTDCVKVLNPLKNANGDYAHAIFKTYWSETYFSSNVDDAKMERIMALYDYLLSEEGRELLTYGFEGEDYTKNGDEYTILTENIGSKYSTKGILAELVAYNTSDNYKMSSPVIVNQKIRQEACDYVDWLLANTTVPKYYPELTMLKTDTKVNFSVMDHDDLLNIMMGEEDVETMWNALLNQYETKGLSKMIDEVNAAAATMNLD